ncbi:MAG: NAD(P)-dependent alcohol dehydrogenase [Nesterenkonia sp.]
MKTARRKTYGGPRVLERADRPVPQITPDQILVKVAYSTVNRTDLGFLYGRPLLTRVFSGLLRPGCPVLGCEFSGVVEEVGADTSGFAVGDRVFGYDDRGRGFGGHAEYKAISSTSMVTTVPEGVSFASAAASTEGAHYALSFADKVTIGPGERVLVHGATGAIGSAMVQLLIARDVEVTATSPTEHLETVRAFGAAQLIDWRTQPLGSLRQEYDYFFDAVGKSSFAVARRILKPGGTYISSELGAGAQNLWLSMINPIQRVVTTRSIIFPIPSRARKLLMEIRHGLQTGAFKPLLDREYPLHETAEAFEYVQTGTKLGNVLITVDPPAGASPAA